MTRNRVHASEVVESSRPNEPVRTCVGCRGKGGRSVLLRITVSLESGDIAWDERAVMPGRGAWLHRDERCLQQALTRRAIPRALRIAPSASTAALEQQLAAMFAATSGPSGEATHPGQGT